MKRILLTGGGTGGHIMQIRRGFKFYSVSRNLLDLLKLPLGFIQAWWYVLCFMPDICFSKGGYASVPVVLMCWLFRVPVVIHESDTVPGLSNRLLGKFAKKVCLAFAQTSQYFNFKKIVVTGNPVKQEIINCNKDLIDFKNNKPTILVIGGSQGAKSINQVVHAVLPNILSRANVIHQTGPGKQIDFQAPGYVQFEFITEMAKAYHQADIIISRCGANSLAEISAIKKPSILIPYPYSAGDHQIKNAYIYADNNAGIVLEESNLRPYILLENIFELLDEPLKAKKMGQNASELNPPKAGDHIAQIIINLII